MYAEQPCLWVDMSLVHCMVAELSSSVVVVSLRI